LPERTQQLIDHHRQRLEEVLARLRSQPGKALTGYAMASQMSWSRRRTWDDLSGFERRLAITEALAHVELLHARGQVEKHFADGEVAYFVPVPQ
jgi:hypothetical protein